MAGGPKTFIKDVTGEDPPSLFLRCRMVPASEATLRLSGSLREIMFMLRIAKPSFST
jgi:hypothetical protein